MTYEVKFTSQFKKDLKKAKKQHRDLDKLFDIVNILAEGKALPSQYKDHNLSGNYKNCRECHIAPDWLLIYEYIDDILVLSLTRIGTHAELFKM